MEDIIFFLIVAISIVASVVSNYKKEAKKNEKRVVGQPAPRPIVSTAGTQQKIKTVTSPKNRPSRPIISLEDFNQEGVQAIKPSDYITDIDEAMEFDYNNDDSIDKEAISDQPVLPNKSIFESKDDFRKAIVYSMILERKF